MRTLVGALKASLTRSFLDRPQHVRLRRVLFQIHLWTGLITGIYVVVVSLSGAALLFRPEMQKLAFGEYFTVPYDRLSTADATVVVSKLRAAYPDHRLLGIDWPTYRRDTFLAYLTKGRELRTVLAHPVSGTVLGELPRTSWISQLQDLHFNLLGGETGRTVNGLGACAVLALCLTGLVVWWPGVTRWTRSLRVEISRGWKRSNWDLHSAAGFWLFAWLGLWAVTGVEFAFPQQFRAAVSAISPLTVVRPPLSSVQLKNAGTPPEPRELIARAQQALPNAHLARLVYPSSDTAPYLVLLARDIHGDLDTSDEVSFYFDQYSGALLERRDNERRPRTAGDRLMATLGPLHIASFAPPGVGGLAVKALWALIALGFPLLVVTGAIMWWNRNHP